MTTTIPTIPTNQSNKWFGNSVHEAYASAGDRIKHVRNRALYKNTMNIAAQGGLKRMNNSNSRATYAPATLLNSACKSLTEETGENGCVAYYIRSAPSYENLLRTTQGIYEGRALRTTRGEILRLRVVLGTGANAAIVRGTGISNPLVTTNKINYLSLSNGNGSTSDLLALTPALDPVTSQSINAAYDASRREPIDPAQCMQYPPDPNLSITYGGGGCYVFEESGPR
jgi:hypothetical protein